MEAKVNAVRERETGDQWWWWGEKGNDKRDTGEIGEGEVVKVAVYAAAAAWWALATDLVW